MRLAVCQGFQTGIRDLFESNPRFGELLVCQSATNRKRASLQPASKRKTSNWGMRKTALAISRLREDKKDRLRPKERKDEEGGG